VTKYLLDTNILSDLVRNPQGVVADRITAAGEAQVATSVIVAAELRYGAEKKGSERLSDQLESILSVMPVLPLDPPADLKYGILRTQLERKGTPIGGNDMLIAAQALALGFVLVTANEREFKRVNGLQIENWLR
jgi:tRNA(fMet)-specific endonuclease VapC